MGNVLHRVRTLFLAGRLEVEWAKIHGVVSGGIDPVEGDTDEALLRDVLAAQVEFDDAVAEVHALDERRPVSLTRIEAGDRPVTLLC